MFRGLLVDLIPHAIAEFRQTNQDFKIKGCRLHLGKKGGLRSVPVCVRNYKRQQPWERSRILDLVLKLVSNLSVMFDLHLYSPPRQPDY